MDFSGYFGLGEFVRIHMSWVFTIGPPKPRFLEVFMVNNLVFTWSIHLFFMVLGADGI